MSALDAALARLESGEPLPKEPGILELKERGLLAYGQFYRLIRAGEAIKRKINRDICERVPVECAYCGAMFTRKRIDQKRCQECIDRAKPQRR